MAINSPALLRSTAIGTVAQLAMVIGGHYSLAIANLFAVLGMAISLGAGVLYARRALPVHAQRGRDRGRECRRSLRAHRHLGLVRAR